MSVLNIKNVSYSTGGKPLVSDVNLAVEAGDFVGLLGPNGSGKTTLIRLMTGILKGQQGSIQVNGIDVGRLSVADLARHMAVVPQEAVFSFPYAVEDIVAMGRYARISDPFGMMAGEDHRVIAESMSRTDCSDFAKRSILTLSGGEKQRVLIARALTQETKILILDEPNAHLDLKYQRDLSHLFKKLNTEGMTIFCVMHDLDLAAHCCNKVALMRDGRIDSFGKTDDVLTPDNLTRVFDVAFDTSGQRRPIMRWK